MARSKSRESLLHPLFAAKPRRAAHAEVSPSIEALWHVVSTIPAGEVWTYGAVARAAGLVRGARQAGLALRIAPKSMNLPWHRVLGSGGRIVFPRDSRQHREQVRCLRADGVPVRNGRVPASLLQSGAHF